MTARFQVAELQGIWRSKGYNRILDISRKGFVTYDLSKVSCIEVRRGSLSEFESRFDRFEHQNEDQFTMLRRGGITRYTFVKQTSLPQQCQDGVPATTKDPELNFEVFWHYFDENYAFFELRNADWDQIYKTCRPQVTSKTTDDELLETFSAILGSLGDLHVSLRAGERVIESGERPVLLKQWQREFGIEEEDELYLAGFKKLRQVITKDFLHGQSRVAANNLVVWGKIEPNIGYLNILEMSGYAGRDAPLVDDLAALEEAMDQVMEDFRPVDAVVVDVRFNPGGEDSASLLIANRFADQERLAFSKKAVQGDRFTETQEIYVYPEGEFQFTRPTVLLTSDATISAAEIFTLCMMVYPHVTRVGESTQGVLSDVLGKQLPNGWKVGISNEVYTAADENCYEGMGIPVQVELPVFVPEYFYGGLELAVRKAISLIRGDLIALGKLKRPSLDEFITSMMETSHLPGLAACIVKNNGIAWSKGYGWANIEQRIPMTPDTLMNIGSISKTITATAIMQLWEEGKFQLDDDINNHLPFAVKNPFHPNEPITFRQLLTHTSSIHDGPAYEESYSCGDPKIPLRTWVEEYLTPGGVYYNREENFHDWKPGEEFDYCNVPFGLLGYLVEAISGSSFSDYCQANIFEPLGMNETSWYLADLDTAKHAVPYTYVSKGEIRGRLLQEGGNGQEVQEREGYIPNCLYSFPNLPDGLLRTSVHQLARFLMAYINNGSYEGRRILQESTVREILTSQLDQSMLLPSPWEGLGLTWHKHKESQGLTWYQLGLDSEDLVWGHRGSDPGITTAMLFRPTDGVGVIVFINTDWGWGLEEIAKRLFQEASIL